MWLREPLTQRVPWEGEKKEKKEKEKKERCKPMVLCKRYHNGIGRRKRSHCIRLMVSNWAHAVLHTKMAPRKLRNGSHLLLWLPTTVWLNFTSMCNSSQHAITFTSLLMQTDLQSLKNFFFFHTIGDQQALKTNGKGSLNNLKTPRGKEKSQFALSILLLPMHEAWYQALSGKFCTVSLWHLDNWLGKSFPAISKLKGF